MCDLHGGACTKDSHSARAEGRQSAALKVADHRRKRR